LLTCAYLLYVKTFLYGMLTLYNSLVYWRADNSSSILLKSGNAFFGNATPSDQRHIEKPFKVKEAEPVNVTKPSPHKVMVPWKIRDSSIF
jgi:hypothetical protein